MFLKKHGRDVLHNGYNLYPVGHRTKGIYEDGWQNSRATSELLDRWQKDQPTAGISIITGAVVAVDVDVYDADTSNELVTLAFEMLGDTIRRVGQKPKALLVYRVSEPVAKATTSFFATGSDKRSRVEILGRGQQFVAFNIHPDTKEPYQWFGGDPSDTALWELPEVTPEQLQEFLVAAEKLLKSKFKVLKSTRRGVAPAAMTDDEVLDAFNHKKRPLKLGRDEIDQRLADVAQYSGDYDFWLQVGMALHHQYRGSDEGLVVWDEWSQESSNYEDDACQKKWSSFSEDTTSGVTFATVLHFSNIERVEERWRKLATYKERIDACDSVSILADSICRTIAEDRDITQAVRAILANSISKRSKDLGSPISITDAKKFVRPLSVEDSQPSTVRDAYPWLADWVYVGPDEIFYDLRTKEKLTERAFNAKHNRLMLTVSDRQEGKAAPDVAASNLALNLAEIPVVSGVAHKPSDVVEDMFEFRGLQFANSWRDTGPAVVPEWEWDDAQAFAVECVKKQVEMCAPEKPEIFMSFLAHLVQFRGKKIRWAPLLVGVQGSGKSVWANIMAGVLGYGNSQSIPQSVLASGFLRSLMAAELTVLEELKARAHRYDIENALRDLIANPWSTTTEKNLKPLTQPNHTNFIGTSNYADALPLESNDRRWYVESSVLRTQDDVAAFQERCPDHFDTLARIEFSPHLSAAVRGFLMSYPISQSFKDCAVSAPMTVAKRRMIGVSEDPIAAIIRDIIDSNTGPLFNKTFVSLTILRKHLSLENVDKAYLDPADRKLSRVMREALGMQPMEWRPERPRNVRHSVYGLMSATEEDLRTEFSQYKSTDVFEDAE
jgi:hypothetical protein